MKGVLVRALLTATVIFGIQGLGIFGRAAYAYQPKSNEIGANGQGSQFYVTQMISSVPHDARLTITSEGILLKNDLTNEEHLIPWEYVDSWYYHGPRRLGANEVRGERPALRILESTGPCGCSPQNELRFTVRGPIPDGAKLFKDMEEHRPLSASQIG
jgi:hypothetical protein